MNIGTHIFIPFDKDLDDMIFCDIDKKHSTK